MCVLYVCVGGEGRYEKGGQGTPEVKIMYCEFSSVVLLWWNTLIMLGTFFPPYLDLL